MKSMTLHVDGLSQKVGDLYRAVKHGIVAISLASMLAVSGYSTPSPIPTCGAPYLQAVDAFTSPGEQVTIDFILSDTTSLPEGKIDAFDISVSHDDNMVPVFPIKRGNVTEGWTYFNGTAPYSGLVRVGGYEPTNGSIVDIPSTLFSIAFEVNSSATGIIYLDLHNPMDDISNYCLQDGYITISDNTPTPTPLECLLGDTTCDNNITPADALLAFQIYLGINQPTGQEPCDVLCAADYDSNSSITPQDALCILKEYLGDICLQD